MEQPTFNHTRGDSKRTPCQQCLRILLQNQITEILRGMEVSYATSLSGFSRWSFYDLAANLADTLLASGYGWPNPEQQYE